MEWSEDHTDTYNECESGNDKYRLVQFGIITSTMRGNMTMLLLSII